MEKIRRRRQKKLLIISVEFSVFAHYLIFIMKRLTCYHTICQSHLHESLAEENHFPTHRVSSEKAASENSEMCNFNMSCTFCDLPSQLLDSCLCLFNVFDQCFSGQFFFLSFLVSLGNDIQTEVVEKFLTKGRKWVKLPLSHRYQYAYQCVFILLFCFFFSSSSSLC